MQLKRAFIVVLVSLSILAPVAGSSATPPVPQADTEKKECTVFVTRTGNRYHKEYCTALRKSRIAMLRSKAIEAGYTPCRRCGGSVCER